MLPAPGSALRFLRGALVAVVMVLPSCSVALDWTGYSDGPPVAMPDAGDGGEGGDAEGGVSACQAICRGCCDNKGFCAAGQSTATCGTSGQPCEDCGARSLVCRASSCAAPVPDAGPPPACDPAMCNTCIPAIQTGCCKADHTCGCKYVPAPGVPPGCN